MKTKPTYIELEKENEALKEKVKFKESENKYKILTNSTIDIIYMSDLIGNLLFLNEQHENVFGRTAEEVVGTNIVKYIPKREFVRGLAIIKQILQGQNIINYKTAIYHKNGELIPVEINGRITKVDNKRVLIGSIRDLRKELKNKKALAESEKRYETLFQNSFSIMLIIKPEDGQIINANKTACNYYGYSLEKIITMNINQINVMSENQMKKQMEMVRNNKQNQFFFQHKLANNEIRDVEVFSRKINISGRSVLYSIIHDITEKVQAQRKIQIQNKQLKKLNTEKDKFLSIIAHDLKSPFSALLGLSKLLTKNFDNYDVQKQKKFVNIVHQGMQNIYKLLENLLLWSRSQKGTVDFNPINENLFLLAEETILLLTQAIASKTIYLKNDIPENLIAKVDKNMFLIVIRNLISNAIKFTPREGIILIKACLTEDENKKKYIEISVKDNGVGILPEIQAQLFNISHNTSTHGTENETGTGLGLILCKEFVEKHGAKIWIESKVDEGSEFIFTLPVH